LVMKVRVFIQDAYAIPPTPSYDVLWVEWSSGFHL
jgi:hypothetical protein